MVRLCRRLAFYWRLFWESFDRGAAKELADQKQLTPNVDVIEQLQRACCALQNHCFSERLRVADDGLLIEVDAFVRELNCWHRCSEFVSWRDFRAARGAASTLVIEKLHEARDRIRQLLASDGRPVS